MELYKCLEEESGKLTHEPIGETRKKESAGYMLKTEEYILRGLLFIPSPSFVCTTRGRLDLGSMVTIYGKNYKIEQPPTLGTYGFLIVRKSSYYVCPCQVRHGPCQ